MLNQLQLLNLTKMQLCITTFLISSNLQKLYCIQQYSSFYRMNGSFALKIKLIYFLRFQLSFHMIYDGVLLLGGLYLVVFYVKYFSKITVLQLVFHHGSK